MESSFFFSWLKWAGISRNGMGYCWWIFAPKLLPPQKSYEKSHLIKDGVVLGRKRPKDLRHFI